MVPSVVWQALCMLIWEALMGRDIIFSSVATYLIPSLVHMIKPGFCVFLRSLNASFTVASQQIQLLN